MASSTVPGCSIILTILEEKQQAHAALLAMLPEEDLRAAERTGIHIDREREVIEIAVRMTSVVPNNWKIRADLGSVNLRDYPSLALSHVSGFVLI